MDGKQDLLVGTGDGNVVLFRNTGSSKEVELASATALVTGRGHGSTHQPGEIGSRAKVCVNDWNEDGKPDLLVGDFYSSDSIFHGNVWLLLRKHPSNEKTASAPSKNKN